MPSPERAEIGRPFPCITSKGVRPPGEQGLSAGWGFSRTCSILLTRNCAPWYLRSPTQQGKARADDSRHAYRRQIRPGKPGERRKRMLTTAGFRIATCAPSHADAPDTCGRVRLDAALDHQHEREVPAARRRGGSRGDHRRHLAAPQRCRWTSCPSSRPPTVEIQTEALGLSAAEVEQLITVPLEQDLLNGVAFLDDIRSESVPGLSRILLDLRARDRPLSSAPGGGTSG